MACFYPLQGWRSKTRSPNGGRKVVFQLKEGLVDRPVNVPCGKCVGCKMESSRQWAVRCSHEASLYESNCFITLTYNDEHLPHLKTLEKKTFQDFMKRLRDKYYPTRIRFYMCGEYGPTKARPHYHACLFNHDFSDRTFWNRTKAGSDIFRSEELEKLWIDTSTGKSLGYSSIGAVTYQSASYVARYVMQKRTGSFGAYDYLVYDDDGQAAYVLPEYTQMSLKPAIGLPFFKKYWRDIYPSDQVIIDGRATKPPRYYDLLLKEMDPIMYREVKARRAANADQDNNRSSRHRVREVYAQRKAGLLPRDQTEVPQDDFEDFHRV